VTRDSGLDVVAPTRSLVGRRAERRWLIARLEEAQNGTPQVVLLRGEAGIGKSRLARSLVEEARDRGITTSIGRFREQPGVPFDAFTGDLFKRLADTAAHEPELVGHTEILRSLATFGSRGSGGPASSETQRVAAVREGFAYLIRRAPFVLLIDDLQWADAGSLDLVVNLVRLAADMGLREAAYLLAVLVVRDEPVVPELSQLDLIRRENVTSSLTLHGLPELEVSRLANAIGMRSLPRNLVGEITRVTRGNPLFVTALVKQFATARTEIPVSEASLSDRLPAEVQSLIGSRVASLGSACQELLAAAAVFGGRCDVGQLHAVTGIDEPVLAELLDEAERFDVLTVSGGNYEFAHPLYERAALVALPMRRRLEMHRRIADVLIETQVEDPSLSVMPIAQHLLAAGELSESQLLLEYCASAGDNAFAGFAWADAAKYYEAAFQASVRLDGSANELRQRLAVRASTAWLHSGDPRAAQRNADAAIVALGDDPAPESLAVAWIERLRADLFEPLPGVPLDTGPLESLAAELELAAPGVAARAYSNLAPVYWANRRVEDARQACFRAIALGGGCGEHATCAEAWVQLAVTQWMRLEIDEALESLEAASRHAVESGDRQKLGLSTTRLPLTLAWLGRFDQAEQAIERAWATTREVGYSLGDGLVLVAQAMIAGARGMYMDADAATEDAMEIGRLTGYQWATSLALPFLAASRSLRGDDEGTEAALESWSPPDAPPDRAAFAWLIRQRAAVAAGHAPARSELEAVWKIFASFPGMSADSAAALVIELAADIGEPELAVEPAEFLTVCAERGQVFTSTMGLFIPTVLGVAASLSGDDTRAEVLLREGIEVAGKLRAHADLACGQYALASLPALASDAASCAELLEAAHRVAHAIGLRPLERRCESLAQRLGVSIARRVGPRAVNDREHETAGATGTAVILFTDIIDSVRLTAELGDWVFHDRARALQASLRTLIRNFSGRPIEGVTLGDGILAEFPSAERAVGCALACRQHANEVAMPLHIGVHAGEVIRDSGDIFGQTVNTAARICSASRGGEILVSQTIRDLARTSSTADFSNHGPHELKGIPESILLYSVHDGGLT
jgi:class 3 adenylate cyclase